MIHLNCVQSGLCIEPDLDTFEKAGTKTFQIPFTDVGKAAKQNKY